MGGAEQLRTALESQLAGVRTREVAPAVRRLVESYRAGGTAPLLDAIATTAYAAYRMPATFAAVRAVLAQLPDPAPGTLLDLGGGTGAAAWAAADRWPDLSAVTVLDRSGAALDLGRRLAADAPWPALRTATWTRHELGGPLPAPADVVTAAYVLTELPERVRASVVDAMSATTGVVVVVEPGTPAGFRTVLAVRERLLAAGLTIHAPCPHDDACPLAAVDDWCHMAVRLDRSALHRAVKGGALGYEDEKFSYVVAGRMARPDRPDGRVLRHPRVGKGHIAMSVCRADGVVASATVTRRDAHWRSARDVRWGDPWPPASD